MPTEFGSSEADESYEYPWLEVIRIYLKPDGDIFLVIGSERLHVNSEQLEKILQAHLYAHSCIVQVIRESNGHVFLRGARQ